MTQAIVWSLCASDSRCGAGMQALLTQAAINNVECRTIVTELTAQSHLGVAAAEPVAITMLEAQWQAAECDGLPDAVLIGWLPPNAELIRWVKNKVMGLECPIIWDPVLQATEVIQAAQIEQSGREQGSGKQEAQKQSFDAAIAAIRELIPIATIMTPSLAEACWLVNDDSNDDTCSALEAGRQLQQQGAHTVMVSGGDSHPHPDTTWVTDIVISQQQSDQPETCVLPEFALHQRALFQKNIRKQAHGTGSQLAAAITVHIARGERLYDALLMGSLAAREALKNARFHFGNHNSHYGNTLAAPLPDDGDEWPLITAVGEQPEANSELKFPRMSALGLYALTDNLEHLDSLIRLKVDTIQWRVKEKNRDYQKNTAIALQRCREAGIPFWLNDDWQLALEPRFKVKPDGVHLGQEDMTVADLNRLKEAGIAIGISTHTHWEIARARAINPSYIAFGPVFPPLSKRLKYPPLGIAQVRQWHERYASWAHTCIGGIVPSNAETVTATGIGSLAIVTCLQPGPEQENNVIALQQALKTGGVSPKYLSSVERLLIKEKK